MQPKAEFAKAAIQVPVHAIIGVLAAGVPALAAPQIFVDWGLPGTPQQPADYEVDYSNPSVPDVELKTGDTTWYVWSRDSVTEEVSDIGDIEAYGFADYGLVLADLDGEPGARHVQSVVLTPEGAYDSGISAYSGLIPSTITGNLTGGLTLQDEGGGIGGYCQLTVYGDVSGIWHAPGPTSVIVEGDVTSFADLTFGYILGSFLEIYGNVQGPIDVTQGLLGSPGDPAWITIGGNLDADLTLGNLTGPAIMDVEGDCSATISFFVGGPPSGAFPDNASLTIGAQLTPSGRIDLNGHALEGDLTVSGDGAGEIVGIDSVASAGFIELGTLEAHTFSGSLEAGTVYGDIDIENLSGTVTGSIKGSGTLDIRGSFLPEGQIDLYGHRGIVLINSAGRAANADGDVTVTTAAGFPSSYPFTGSVTVFESASRTDGDLNGTFRVVAGLDSDGDIEGSITVEGSLGSTGQILIDGAVDEDAVLGFDSLAGTIEYDANADGVGQWLGTIEVAGDPLPPACYWGDLDIGGGSIYSGSEYEIDCNSNGIPDACDIDSGSSPDCNTNGVPEECEQADWDGDGDVDLADFQNFQTCFASTNSACLNAFDRAFPCGEEIDLNDFATFYSQLTGPAVDGGGNGDGGDGGGDGGGGEAPPPPSDPWTYEYADVLLEVRPVGGHAPLTVLAPNTTYEIHYQADYDRVHLYILFAVATSPGHGFAAASPPPAGDWSDTGRFRFEDIEQEWGEPSTAAGYPDGYFRYQMATDDFYWPSEDDPTPFAGPEGHLCNITTQSPGELNLHLYAVWIDDSEYLIVDMQTQALFVVETSDDEDDE